MHNPATRRNMLDGVVIADSLCRCTAATAAANSKRANVNSALSSNTADAPVGPALPEIAVSTLANDALDRVA